MSTIKAAPESKGRANPSRLQKLIANTTSAWHATFPTLLVVNETVPGNFSNPDPAEVDRIPELALANLGAPGTYVITGVFDGATQTENITTIANATVKGDLPFDTITSITGPDPGANLDLRQGDSLATPPARAMWSGAGGAVDVQLAKETAPKVITLPAGIDWAREVKRVRHDGTTVADAFLVW